MVKKILRNKVGLSLLSLSKQLRNETQNNRKTRYMLTPTLQHIKDSLEVQATAELSMEQSYLLKELQFLYEDTDFRELMKLKSKQVGLLGIGPSPDKCPTCGRRW